MANELTTLIAGFKTNELVALYNLPRTKPIKKFETRAKGEKAVANLISPIDSDGDAFSDYAVFVAKYGLTAAESGVKLPTALGGKENVAPRPPANASVSSDTKPAIAVITDQASDAAVAAVDVPATTSHLKLLQKKVANKKVAPVAEVVLPPEPAVVEAPVIAGSVAPAAAPKKQNTPPHLNLRCPIGSCGYYAKTTPGWLAKGRLVCPMNPAHGILKTAEERAEKRGKK